MQNTSGVHFYIVQDVAFSLTSGSNHGLKGKQYNDVSQSSKLEEINHGTDTLKHVLAFTLTNTKGVAHTAGHSDTKFASNDSMFAL